MTTSVATVPAGFVSKAPRLGFVSGFDGIRGIFVVAVILEHIFPGQFESFAVVLDTFFVMSAFLIVTLLMQEQRDNGSVNIKKFYQRRAVRLLPSAYVHMLTWVVLGFVLMVAGVTFDGRNPFTEVLKDVAAAFTYTYHLVFPVGLAAIDPAERFRVLGHFWSLSLEEQFYMVVAITMVVCLRKNWIRPLAVLCGAAALWIAWSRYNVDLGPWPGNTVSSAVLKRGFQLFWIERPDALLWGVVLAVINAYLPQGVTERFRRPILAVGWVALFTLGFSLIWSSKAAHSMGWPFYLHNVPDAVRNHASGLQCALKTTGDQLGAFRPCTDTMWFFRVGHNLTAISIAPVMFCFARYKDWLPNRILGFKVFSLNGRLSYTLYIWHALGIFLVTAVIGEHASKPVRLVLCLIVIYAISWPVYVFVEQKALKRKLRYAAEKEVLDLRTGKMVNVDDAIKDGEKSTKKRRRHER